MKRAFRKSFGKIAAITYLTGIVLHVFRVAQPSFGPDQIPFWFDAWIIFGTGYGVLGYLLFRNEVVFPSRLSVAFYILIALHLFFSIFLHTYNLWAGHHEIHRLFTPFTNLTTILVLAGFAWYSWTLEFKVR